MGGPFVKGKALGTRLPFYVSTSIFKPLKTPYKDSKSRAYEGHFMVFLFFVVVVVVVVVLILSGV